MSTCERETELGAAESDYVELSQNQKLIWLGQCLTPDVPLYDMIHVFRISGELDPASFVEAFRRMVMHVDVMRLAFCDDGRDRQEMIRHTDCRQECEFADLTKRNDTCESEESLIRKRSEKHLQLKEALYDSLLIRRSAREYSWYLKIHHLLTDGLNGRALVAELSRRYESVRSGRPPRTPHQYVDYVNYEAGLQCQNQFDSAQAWWTERSESQPASCFYRGKAASGSARHERIVIKLPRECSQDIRSAATTRTFRQFSPALAHFNIFATALAVWLHRLEGNNEFCIGATVHGRSRPQFRDTIGVFMQLLPLRCCVDGSDSMATVANKLAIETAGFLKHAIPGVTTPETQRCFDVALNFIDLSVGDFCGLPTTMEWIHNGHGDPARRLTVSVRDVPNTDDFEVCFDFNDAAFGTAEQSAAIDHFSTVLAQVVRQPEIRVSDLKFLSTTDRAFLARHLTGRRILDTDVHSSPNVWEKFVSAKESAADTPAVRDEVKSLSYHDLHKQAQLLSRELETRDGGPIIPLLCGRNVDTIIAMLGVMASGRCFMPVDSDLPSNRIATLMADSAADIFVDCRNGLSISVNRHVTEHRALADCANSSAEKACYLLYTSGSTGRPNGAIIGHTSLITLLDDFENRAPIRSLNCSWWTNVGFDVAIYEVFSALLYGRTLHIPSDRVRGNARRFFDWLNESKIVSAYVPPFFIEDLKTYVNHQTLPLERLLVGVEPIPHELLRSIAETLPELKLINGYGPTEATICATLSEITSDHRHHGIATIGRPTVGNTCRIVDAYSNDVPPGVGGELLIGGAGLALCYHNRPELTVQRFQVDSDSETPDRWYRTGDRVRQRPDGQMEFLGRFDSQVKVNGHRVEPNEIAQCLRTFPGVTECFVSAEKVSASLRLIAFYSAAEKVPESDLRLFAASHLPQGLVPSRFVFVKTFPRGHNGKIDVTGLLQDKSMMRTVTRTPPRTPLQLTLYSIWRDVLKLADFGVDESFFELGGDSLDALAIVSQAEENGLSLAPSDVFSRPTIADLASLFDNDKARIDPFTESSPCTVYERNRHSSQLSPRQERLWYLARLYPNSPAYHVHVSFRVNGSIAPDKVADCLNALIARHAALRLNIVEKSGAPQAIIRDRVNCDLSFHDLRRLSSVDRPKNAKRILREQGVAPFDLESDNLFRVSICQTGDDRFQMAWTFHHIAVDQKSVQILLQEFQNHYRASTTCTSSASSITNIPIVESPLSRKDLEYWVNELSDCPKQINLPYDFPTAKRTQEGNVVEFELPKHIAQRLTTIAREEQVSLNVAMLTAFNLLLHRYTNDDVTVVGVPFSARRSKDAVGFFVESLPFRSQFRGNESFLERIRSEQASFLRALDHSHISLDELIRRINPPRTNANPLFQVMLVTQSRLKDVPLDESVSLRPSVEHLGTSKLDLTLFVSTSETEIDCCFEYSTDLFRRTTIEQLRDSWIQMLTSIVYDPTLTCERLSLISPKSNASPYTGISHSKASDKTPLVRQSIEHHCRMTPGKTAIVFGNQTVNYGQLNKRAEKLAAAIRDSGFNPADSIAMILPRSSEVIISILAILKTGAPYVPISPGTPPVKRNSILEDCGADFVISDRKIADIPATIIDVTTCRDKKAEDAASLTTACQLNADSLAYIIYTSGSTGRPKGVEISHRSLALSTAARDEYYKHAPERFLLLSPFWFDSSIAGIFWTLCSGGTLVLPEEGTINDVAALSRLIESESITHSLALPSLYEVLLDHATEDSLASLQTMIVAGEPCSRRVVDKHFATVPNAELHNEYGPSEATVWSTVHQFSPDEERSEVSIGKPVPHTQACVLDRNLQPVPVGVPGELCLAGPKLARGYRNRAELTKAAFIPNPFSTDATDRLYRTGDLVKQRPDGSFLFLGRVDNQLKINGHRVEPEEIEAAVASLPGISEVVVGKSTFVRKVNDDIESLTVALQQLPANEAEALLSSFEKPQREGSIDDPEESNFVGNSENVEATFQFKTSGFVETPRPSQRKWLINQAIGESIANLQHLNRIAPDFVPGSSDAHVPHDISESKLTDQEIMEDWQTPLMQAMADYATESHGDVIEIGFGRGVSATMIQNGGVKSHTIVESNPHSINDHFVPWKKTFPNQNIRLIKGRWQETLEQMELYDAVFFHAFPLNEAEFVEYVANSTTFAEHFFPTAASLLRDDGAFTYLTTEIDSLSRRHQRSLFEHFKEVRMKVQPLNVPIDTKDSWWANSMVVLQAKK